MSTSLHAEGYQSLDELKTLVQQYVYKELSRQTDAKILVSADKIDTRLKLIACDTKDMEIFNPYQTALQSASTIGIRCKSEDNRWTLYVSVKIAILKSVVVSEHPLAKGSRITSADLSFKEMDINQIKQGYFNTKEEVLDFICKQNINQGSPITLLNVERPVMVHKGDPVMIVATNNTFKITMKGIAQHDGHENEIIKVKNLTSKRVIDALVDGTQQVKVQF